MYLRCLVSESILLCRNGGNFLLKRDSGSRPAGQVSGRWAVVWVQRLLAWQKGSY